MGTFKDLTGKKIGLLTVVSRAETRKLRTYWNVRCECGVTKVVQQGSLARESKKWKVKSCGCHRYIMHAKRLRTHGMKGTVELALLDGAKRRAKAKRILEA